MIDSSLAISKRRRRWAKVLAVARKTAAAVAALALVWLAWWWIRYPHVPDVKQASLAECSTFMASGDFNRMTHRDRTRFALATIDKLKDKSFSDLVALGFKPDPSRDAAAKNIRQLSKGEQTQIGNAFLGLFFDKFYAQDAAKRNVYLMGLVMMQKSGGPGFGKGNAGIPTGDKLKSGLADFIANQPPHNQASLAQFLTDLSKEQRMLGVKRW